MTKNIVRAKEIAADEVKQWFGNREKGRLNEVLYRDIADRLNKMNWPSDQAVGPSKMESLAKSSNDRAVREQSESEDDQWWDSKAAADAATLLLRYIPPMLQHSEGLRWATETSSYYDAIKALEVALSNALPYIQFPFGQYQADRRHTPKQWHSPAIGIASIVVKAMIQSGAESPSLQRNSIAVGVVRKAIIRIGFAKESAISATALSQHLTRWHNKFGLSGLK